MNEDRSKEILHYLAAMSREIGEFRQETKVRFDAVETRLDAVEKSLGEVSGRLEKIEARLDKLEERIDRLEGRFDRLEGRFDRLETEMHAGLEAIKSDVRQLARKMEVLNQDSLELRARHRDVEIRVDALEKKTGVTDTP